jgi:hypothetical protein
MHRLADAPVPLLRALNPRHHPGVYAFVSAPESADLAALRPLATFRESEGLTLIVGRRAPWLRGCRCTCAPRG